MHAYALESLLPALNPGAHVLDVGSGSGYLTACFSELVGEQGKVVGIEHIQELVQDSIENVKRSGRSHLLDSGAIEFVGKFCQSLGSLEAPKLSNVCSR